MNKMQYDKRLSELVQDAKAIHFNFRDGSYANYVLALKRINEFKKGNSVQEYVWCEPCEGKGKKKDSTGFYPIRCVECCGTGMRALPIPMDEHTIGTTTPLSQG